MSDSSSSGPRGGGADDTPSLFAALADWLSGLGGGRNGEATLRESLDEVLEEHEDGTRSLEPEERAMLSNILEFGDRRAGDVMVPRADIVGVEVSTSREELMALFAGAAHSRLPVYRETLDDPLGMVHIKDLLAAVAVGSDTSLADMVRQVLIVPPSIPVLELLSKMRATRRHMALVVDEYGGTDGLVTIEDVVEEIVGEIEDEHDEVEKPLVAPLRGGGFEADARVTIAEFEEHVGCDLLPDEKEEDIDTLGGLVFSLFGRVPGKGEVISHPSGLRIEVLEADPRRVLRLKVGPMDEVAGAGEDGGTTKD